MQKILPIILLLFLVISLSGQTIKPVVKKGLYGFSDGKRMVLDFQYDTIRSKYDHYYYVRKGGKWGMVSPLGKEIISCIYDEIEGWWYKINVASLNGFKGIVDSTGNILFDFIYDDIDHEEGDSALVKYQGKWCWYYGGTYSYNQDDLIFQGPDNLPYFPGCENSNGTYESKKKCADELMFSFIYNNLNYPAEARKKGIQGQVILRFIVTRNGEIRNVKVVRSLGGGCDEECITMMNKMPSWIPARNDGLNVASIFTLPVKFVLK